MKDVSIEAVLGEYRTHLDNTIYNLMITKAALADAVRQISEKDAELAELRAAKPTN